MHGFLACKNNFSNGKFIIEILSENKNIVLVAEQKEVIVITRKELSFMLQYAIVIAFNGKCLKKVPVRNKKNRKNFKNNFFIFNFCIRCETTFYCNETTLISLCYIIKYLASMINSFTFFMYSREVIKSNYTRSNDELDRITFFISCPCARLKCHCVAILN